MAGYALVMMSPNDEPWGRGRMVHLMKTAVGLAEAGEDVEVYFSGIGVTWFQTFAQGEHPFVKHYREAWDAMQPLIAGACEFCSKGRFKVEAHVDALGHAHVGPAGGHHDLVDVLRAGRQVLTF